MANGKELWERSQKAQELLGTGQTDDALQYVQPIRAEAIKLLNKGPLLTSFERSHANAAYAYATVTMILSIAEAKLPAEFVPKVRELAVEAVERFRPGTDIWKAVAAAGEVLARAGDSQGAVWAIKMARKLSPDNDELMKIAGGISSMYPQVYKEMSDDLPSQPPDMPAAR